MNDELNTELLEVQVDSVSDSETLVEGSETVIEVETEIETEIETEVKPVEETEVEINTEEETEVETDTEEETEVNLDELKDIRETLENNNNTVQELTNILLQSEPAEIIDYSDSLNVIYHGLVYENNNFCLGVESLLLGIGILSGLIFGFVFRSIFKR